MPDYGLPLQFGLSVMPDANQIDETSPLVIKAEQTNLDFVAIQDHPYNRHHLDTWTLITFLIAQTQRVRFFPDVVSLPMRPPAMLAKAVASLDRLSKGRIELGLGAGTYWDGIAAMDGTRRTPAEAVEALEEAIQVIRLVWSGQHGITFNGAHYHLRGYQSGPVPAHMPSIWLGAVKPRMLRLTGRQADGWISPLSTYTLPEQAAQMQRVIDQAAQQAGRPLGDIRRIYNVVGTIDEHTSGDKGLTGSVDTWISTLTQWAIEIGFDTFIFWPSEATPVQVEQFALEVAPAVRAAVEQVRRSTSV